MRQTLDRYDWDGSGDIDFREFEGLVRVPVWLHCMLTFCLPASPHAACKLGPWRKGPPTLCTMYQSCVRSMCSLFRCRAAAEMNRHSSQSMRSGGFALAWLLASSLPHHSGSQNCAAMPGMFTFLPTNVCG